MQTKDIVRTDLDSVTFLESVEAKVFPDRIIPELPEPLKAHSSNHGGTVCWACQSNAACSDSDDVSRPCCRWRAAAFTLDRMVTRARASCPSESGSKKATALPVLPQRPVLPIRWTYSSMLLGRSKFTTCWTSGMSRPRAATEVATSTGHLPERKSARACSRSRCSRSLRHHTTRHSSAMEKRWERGSPERIAYPWMLVVGILVWLKKVAMKSACLLVSTNTMVRSDPATKTRTSLNLSMCGQLYSEDVSSKHNHLWS